MGKEGRHTRAGGKIRARDADQADAFPAGDALEEFLLQVRPVFPGHGAHDRLERAEADFKGNGSGSEIVLPEPLRDDVAVDGNLPVDFLGIGQVVLVRFLIPDRLDLPLGLDGAVVLSESKRTELSAAAAKERLQLAGRPSPSRRPIDGGREAGQGFPFPFRKG